MKPEKQSGRAEKKAEDPTPPSGSNQAHPLLISFFVVTIGLIIALQAGLLESPQFMAGGQADQGVLQAGVQASGNKPARMSLSPFDREMGHELMDADGDGMCDTCGMPVDMCISGGQMQCTMGGSGGIGELGSAHIHADWKAYINGEQMDWSSIEDLHERQMRGNTSISGTSAFLHMHPEKDRPAGSVLHMHAKGVPLQLFFRSVGMNLTDECLSVSEREAYCSDKNKSLKLFVNGKAVGSEGSDVSEGPDVSTPSISSFVFKDGDQILLSYGPRDENLSAQLASITNFSKMHTAHDGDEGGQNGS